MSSPIDELLSLPPFGVAPDVKSAALLAAVHEAMAFHCGHCAPFARWCTKQGFDPGIPISDLAAVPFLPVGIFKRLLLSSVPQSEIVRVLTSSATSSQVPSRIPLDQVTRNRQMRTLASILSSLLGVERRAFIVLDAPPDAAANGDQELSARVAGMRGYLMAAAQKEYVLVRDGDHWTLDVDKFRAVVDRWKAEGKRLCLLGYTYVLHQGVVRPLVERGIRIELPESTVVLHFGGWKRLQDQAVDKASLGAGLAQVFGLPPSSVRDVYGFTEQLGVIYPDDADGLKRVPTYAEVLVRNPRTLEIVPDGQTGLLEFICPLAHSYPGIAILLDDLGRVVTRQAGADGMTGAAIEVTGRARRAEPRGCGDTLPEGVYAGGSIAP